jgi:hemoglobin
MDTMPEAARCRAIHPADLTSSEDKLYDYLTGYLGGPPVYVEKYGHPMLRRRHFGAHIGPAERDEWLLCFRLAMEETIPNPKLREIIWAPVERLGFHMQNQEVVLFLSGILGAAGVMLAAAATHTGETHMLGNASTMCLAHAPVLLALYIGWDRVRTAMPAGLILGLGTVLFVGDLVSRHFMGSGLFPMAAPTGGMVMIGGWALLAISAFLAMR